MIFSREHRAVNFPRRAVVGYFGFCGSSIYSDAVAYCKYAKAIKQSQET